MGVVVTILVALQITVYVIAFDHLLRMHFWDPVYALKGVEQHVPINYMKETITSYLTVRYKFFLPHVIGAFVWWNLYFFQLIPSIRRKYKAFHRWLGRLLLFTAIVQTWSGLGMAWHSPSSRIKIVSLLLAIGVAVCVYYSARFGMKRDIIRHKFWSKRLVGYMQVISLQRFWNVVLLVLQNMGWIRYLYPGLESYELNDVIKDLFDDTFVLALATGILGTEFYLSYEAGMMNIADDIGKSGHIKNE